VDDKGADGLIMDDPRDADEWMPDEAGYGYGV
jgi:hypothetical protein